MRDRIKTAFKNKLFEKNVGRSRYFLHLGLEEIYEIIDDIFDSQEDFDKSNAHPTKGCGIEIMVRENGAQHQSFCGCTYKGLHLCDTCAVQNTSEVEE